MTKAKPLLTIFILLLLSGCATHQKFVERHNSWVGKNITYFIEHNGYPDSTITLPNTHKVYIYEKKELYSTPMTIGFGYYGGPLYPYGSYGIHQQVHQSTCKLFIETNKKGTILKWRSKGNDCRSN
jgi:uncharacterized protein YcfL